MDGLWTPGTRFIECGEKFLATLADAELERDDARRHTDALRGLLGRVLDEIENLPPMLREEIERTLASW